MANALMGVLYKKTFDSSGNVNGKIPFLPRTLSNLVIMNGTGTTLASKITSMDSATSKAQTTANTAKSTADAATSTANTAKSTADSAKSIAAEAKSSATATAESFKTFASMADYNTAWSGGNIKSTVLCLIKGA